MSLAIAGDADNKNCAYCFINLCGLCWKVPSPLKPVAYDDGAPSPTASFSRELTQCNVYCVCAILNE
ncbi:hypothetical protein MTR_2g099340 [Medicago truncatula]|uniref:Uncharacterized protein n=1 Tax=Medicago truncatula TaxID=3880 RepID=G7IS08_MEDTR|nr:hypothetical protein MTR_2g099340 [Medicago truncatula]